MVFTESKVRDDDPVDDVNHISGDVVDAAIKVHRTVGPGLLERIYVRCLAHELRRRGRRVLEEVPTPVFYEGVDMGLGYRLDLLVDEAVVVEVKSVEQLHPVHEAQILGYLRMTGARVGLLLNFNEARLKDGIRRFIIDPA